VSCTIITILRIATHRQWNLTHERAFTHTGKEWLLVCLNQVNYVTKTRILLILWRAWHLRNDGIHHNGKESVSKSVSLLSYTSCRHLATTASSNGKGKEPLYETANTDRVVSATAPRPGWIKLNTDASFIVQDKPNAVGAIARDCKGKRRARRQQAASMRKKRRPWRLRHQVTDGDG
jgi:hypothetical protein